MLRNYLEGIGAEMTEFLAEHAELSDAEAGAEAARLIWDDDADAAAIVDPRTPEFANAVIDTSVEILRSSKGLIKRMIKQAAAGAEDLAIAQFQGIIEVIQNADDVRATEVRFALREGEDGRQLLIVHNGQPVTCDNVLGMALPYLTTKTERLDQRGRFGIGMKTLRRIADAVSVHSAPYHFSGDQLDFERIGPEVALPGFYNPGTDTMLLVNLNNEFDEEELREWFEAWQPDGLLFLASVSVFRWCALDGSTTSERALRFSEWVEIGYLLAHPAIAGLVRRRVDGPSDHWTVWRATIEVPAHLHPAHKARSDTTEVSIALADGESAPGLFIGFRSQIPLTVPFSIDAQFDPSTSREAIIENAWNNWLINRSAEVVATIARELLAEAPTLAWSLVPLASEQIGKDDDHWLMARFASAFEKERTWLGEKAAVNLRELVPLAQLSYEDDELTDLLEGSDLERVAPNTKALCLSVRDGDNRWREVLDTINVSTTIGTAELLASLAGGLFIDKPPSWWVDAATCLVEHHPDEALFGTPFLLADDLRVIACAEDDTTDRPVVFEAELSAFALRWRLLDRLHPAFGDEEGKPVIAWLTANAAFTSHLEPDVELAAFVERYSGQLLEIADDELRELRDSFDGISSERRASQLGPKVGAILKIDGTVYKGGKPVRQKVSLAKAYLSKTLDGENSTWPEAAGTTPGLAWIGARYEDVLKTGAGRWAKRKREDGTVSRGPRRFLTLLGAETAPRVVRTDGRVRWGDGRRVQELSARNAEQVEYDLLSPDLASVLKSLQNLNKRDAKQRSPALLRTLSRNWERHYETKRRVPAEHMAIKYAYNRGDVTSGWLNLLCETEWVAVGRGELVLPSVAVIRTPTTQVLYQSFACDVGPEDLSPECAGALQLITDVRIGDIVSKLEELRDGEEKVVQEAQVVQFYRIIAKRCPRVAVYNTRVGEMTAQDLRERFLAGRGLIYVGEGNWKRPDEVMRGMDIFHDRRLFVPGDPACANLWLVLDVREPDLDQCIQFCRELARETCGPDVEAALMDVYRYMEAHIDSIERRHREKLRQLPLYCDGTWVTERPVFWVEDSELRAELKHNVPSLHCWAPPCDVRALYSLMAQMAVRTMPLSLSVEGDTGEAGERGEAMRLRFGHAVDHLSSELARSEPAMRDRIAISWDTLKAIPLFVHEGRIPVRAKSDHLPPRGVVVGLRAFVGEQRQAIHFCQDDIGDRDFGGRAIASLFPAEVRRRIDAEWALAYSKSRDSAAEAIRLASDEKREEAMKEAAATINAGPKGKIKVTPPKSRDPRVTPRTLKQSVGQVAGATVQPGSGKPQPQKPEPSKGKLRTNAPDPGSSGSGNSRGLAPAAYTNADLEQRGWEILTQALETSPDQRLVDFRNRHGVGADGAFDWKRFVEMKATARGPQTQIELSNNEFERAKERGSDFILALVSGLETGQKDEVRLIFDPANCATVRPANGVKLTALLDAPAVVVEFEDAEPEKGDSE